MKSRMMFAAAVLGTASLVAQNDAPKKVVARPTNLTAPTKVTGKPTTTADGLQYWDIKVGTGKTAEKGTNVTVNYTGWLTNGNRFDTSVGKAPFVVENLGNAPVIKGWNEGVMGMKVGGKRQLRIPPALGYGAAGAAGVIPPNATLIFDVEVLKVE